jgi:hypothetical protein
MSCRKYWSNNDSKLLFVAWITTDVADTFVRSVISGTRNDKGDGRRGFTWSEISGQLGRGLYSLSCTRQVTVLPHVCDELEFAIVKKSAACSLVINNRTKVDRQYWIRASVIRNVSWDQTKFPLVLPSAVFLFSNPSSRLLVRMPFRPWKETSCLHNSASPRTSTSQLFHRIL